MAKIKHTKNELKSQREALKRYQRYLPTLQLKKQQLQMELWNLEARMRDKEQEERTLRNELQAWIAMFSEPFAFDKHLSIKDIATSADSIAGVKVPVLDEVHFEIRTPDLMRTPPWVDDGIWMLRKLARLRIERRIIQQQHELIAEEMRITSQRVNLFEKVKIPEAQENIRVIRIFLGDQQTASVARAKIAKRKTSAREAAS